MTVYALENLPCLRQPRYRLQYMWDDNTVAYLPKYELDFHLEAGFDETLCSRMKQVGRLVMGVCTNSPYRHMLCEKHGPEKVQTSLNGASGRQSIQFSKPSPAFGKNVTKIVCPSGHWTREFLAYDVRSVCRQNRKYVRDSTHDTQGSPASLCLSLLSTLFACRTGVERVSYSLVCDHSQDCLDASDEDFCVHPPCSTSGQFECFNKQVRHTGE